MQYIRFDPIQLEKVMSHPAPPFNIEDARSYDHFADIFSQSATTQRRIASIVVICFFGIAVAVVFLAICLLARLCGKAARSVHRKLTIDYRDCPDAVPHTKRVYEIQAEEGVYNQPPEPPEYEELENCEPVVEKVPKQGSLKELRNSEESLNKNGSGAEQKKNNAPSVANRQRERAMHKDSVVANLNPFKHKLKQMPEMV
ncbi:hypothetical protein PENTCL1PPCAC_3985 [Pristionchus entomophagus]|uniref:Uncharacterized protein n=1 Tax=Pristionchus entomophagus TaxID=358040 RepID=A0AAV5SNX3_9BILA|nr:hypothetical protein PENTCL1PPCAC_3985 [Pristionchus entomophagus]